MVARQDSGASTRHQAARSRDGSAVDSKCYSCPALRLPVARQSGKCLSNCQYWPCADFHGGIPDMVPFGDSGATMPRKKYHALDLQQLTLGPRSPSSSSPSSPLSCDFLFSEALYHRVRTSSEPAKTASQALQLPPTCILRKSSREALELLRFGFLDQSSSFERKPSPEKHRNPLIFVESDFPPLQRTSSQPSGIVDITCVTRRVTLPESWQQRQARRSASASIREPELRSRKPTARSTRHREKESNCHRARSAGSGQVEVDKSNYFQDTTKSSRRDSLLVPVESGKRGARNDMASAFPQMSGDARRHYPSGSGSGSTRYENRAPLNRATPCKNGPLCRKFQEGRTFAPCVIVREL